MGGEASCRSLACSVLRLTEPPPLINSKENGATQGIDRHQTEGEKELLELSRIPLTYHSPRLAHINSVFLYFPSLALTFYQLPEGDHTSTAAS